jgi:hypothetical protein
LVVDAAVVGLIGAGIGAAAAVSGAVIAGLLQGRREREAFRRTQKAEAYARAVEYLFRAAARRSELTAQGRAILAKDDQREWFLDLAASLHSLTSVVAYASEGWRDELLDVLQRYGRAVFALTHTGLNLPKDLPKPEPYVGLAPFEAERWPDDLTGIFWEAAVRIQEIATFDLSGYESRQAARNALGDVNRRE